MDDRLRLRRHLYAELARTRTGRRALRKQIRLLSLAPPFGDGPSGVREPRRPPAPRGPAGRRYSDS